MKIGLGGVLDVLPALSPSIKLVCFSMIGVQRVGYVDGELKRGPSFESSLGKLQSYSTRMVPIHWRALRVVVKAFEPNFIRLPGIPLRLSRIAYRLEENPEKKTYCLKMDELFTELLNEEGARRLDEGVVLQSLV